MDQLLIDISKKLTGPLPGREAQLRMAHAIRGRYATQPDQARIACVLLLLYPREDVLHTVFIKRVASNPQDRHGGQISFPGGKLEETDADFGSAALREAEEEVGVIAKDVELLGKLTELYIPVSNFMVHPFVGRIDYTPDFVPQESEVQEIVQTPLSAFRNPAIRQTTALELPGNIVLNDVPYFNINGHVIWGATAMMLNEFLEITF